MKNRSMTSQQINELASEFKSSMTAAQKDFYFEELHKKCKYGIFQYLMKKVGYLGKEHVEDLLQETFISVYNHMGQFKSTKSCFSTWVYTIAKNKMIDASRVDKTRERDKHFSYDKPMLNENNEEQEFQIKCKNIISDEIISREERSKNIKIVLKKSFSGHKDKKRYKRIIELRFFYELSYEEIAEQERLPLGTVKITLFRAKELMKQYIEKHKGLALV